MAHQPPSPSFACWAPQWLSWAQTPVPNAPRSRSSHPRPMKRSSAGDGHTMHPPPPPLPSLTAPWKNGASVYQPQVAALQIVALLVGHDSPGFSGAAALLVVNHLLSHPRLDYCGAEKNWCHHAMSLRMVAHCVLMRLCMVQVCMVQVVQQASTGSGVSLMSQLGVERWAGRETRRRTLLNTLQHSGRAAFKRCHS